MLKKIIIPFFSGLLLLIGTQAFALDPMGPPTATMSKGKVSASVEYIYTDMELERPSGSWSDPGTEEFDLETNKLYAKIAYSFADFAEVFVRVGSTFDLETDQPKTGKEWEGEGDGAFTYGAGFKGTIYNSGTFSIGALTQLTYLDESGDRNGSGGQEDSFDLELLEVQAALGASAQVMDILTLYGGPFLHYVNGTFKHEDSGGNGDTRSIKEDPAFGFYAGGQFNFGNFTGDVEYQYTENSYAIAAMLGWLF